MFLIPNRNFRNCLLCNMFSIIFVEGSTKKSSQFTISNIIILTINYYNYNNRIINLQLIINLIPNRRRAYSEIVMILTTGSAEKGGVWWCGVHVGCSWSTSLRQIPGNGGSRSC